MKLTLANIKELKRNSDSPLLKRVCNYVIGIMVLRKSAKNGQKTYENGHF